MKLFIGFFITASTRSSLKRKVSVVDKGQAGYAWLAEDSGMEMCNGGKDFYLHTFAKILLYM